MSLMLTPTERQSRGGRRGQRARWVRMGAVRNFRHGIYADATVRPDVLDEMALLYARAEWLDPVRDGNLVESTARMIVRLRHIDALSETDPTLQSLWIAAERALVRNLDTLGLTPTAAARLGILRLDARERIARLGEERLAEYRK